LGRGGREGSYVSRSLGQSVTSVEALIFSRRRGRAKERKGDDEGEIKENVRTLTFSRFEVHSIGYDVLQLHQFQLDGFRAAECMKGRVGDRVGGGGAFCSASAAGAALVAAGLGLGPPHLLGRTPSRARPDPLPSATLSQGLSRPSDLACCRASAVRCPLCAEGVALPSPSVSSLPSFHDRRPRSSLLAPFCFSRLCCCGNGPLLMGSGSRHLLVLILS
jgi:hypothetical protein